MSDNKNVVQLVLESDLINQIREQRDRIAELDREKTELMAQVEYVKSHFNELIEVAQRCDSWESFPQKSLDRAFAALESLPTQCLNQIKAEAGRAGFIAGYSSGFEDRDEGKLSFKINTRCDQYAASIAKVE